MVNSTQRLIPESCQRAFMRVLTPLIRLLTFLGVSPNALTIAGVVVTTAGAIAFFLRARASGGCLVLLGGLCDAIDGSLARNAGKATRFGALLDSSVDRYSEFVMLFGIGGYFLMTEDYVSSAATFLALCGSFMVSYTRARAESLGWPPRWASCSARNASCSWAPGALIHPIALTIAIWMVAVFANFTALQRAAVCFQAGRRRRTPAERSPPASSRSPSPRARCLRAKPRRQVGPIVPGNSRSPVRKHGEH